jgi:hypothetical protein
MTDSVQAPIGESFRSLRALTITLWIETRELYAKARSLPGVKEADAHFEVLG